MVKACKLFHLTEDFSVDTASTDNASVAVMCVAYWKKKKKDTASCVVAPEWYFAWKGRGARKKNLFAVELVVFRYELLAVYDSYLERVSQKLGEKKKKNSLCHAEARARFVYGTTTTEFVSLFRSVYFM